MRSSIKTKKDFEEYSDLIIALLTDLGLVTKKDYEICTFEIRRTYTVDHNPDYGLSISIYLDRIKIRPNLHGLIFHIKREIPIFYDWSVLQNNEVLRNNWLNFIQLMINDIDTEVESYLTRAKESCDELHWKYHRF